MSKKFLNVRAVRARYSNISDRTVDRWVRAGVLPKPTYIEKQRYWMEDELDERDKARCAGAEAAAAA
jgi:predicted DNA-binding transcriptional regulator AlpA